MTSKSRQVSKRHRNSNHPLQRLLNYGHNYRQQIWQATAFSIINKLLDLAPPVLIGIAVDVVVKQQDSIISLLGVKDIFWQFLLLSLITVIVWIFESAFEYAYDKRWRNLAQNIQHDLRIDAYNHLQELELAYFEERSTGGLMSILSDDINQLEDFLNEVANEIIQLITSFIVLIGGAFFILPTNIALVAMLPMPFILWGSFVYQNQLTSRYADVREKVGFLNSRLANNISGITTIKSFTAEDYESKRLAAESEAYRHSNSKAIKLSAAFIPLIRILVLVGFTSLLLLGGMAAFSGKISVGNYSILLVLVQHLLWPLVTIGRIFDEYQRAMASTNRVMDLLDTPIKIYTGNIPLPIHKVRGEIEYKEVTFAYHDRHPVIQNLSLHIPAGKTIAIVGSTGSGKSTLVKILLRFYEVSAGTITVDGIDIQKLNLRDLRRSIGLVSQDVFLFHGTVAENIAYGTFDATDESIIMAAKVAEAHEFIMRLPQGYETIVGERGQKLSGGQRQRIAIARAIVKDPPILLLDEATSAVDNETEAAIQRSLDRITVNRTTIAIAHRLSTIRNADCIYVMEHGQLVESGTHEQLLEKNGIYASLWRVQSGLK
ncbi:MULTISPECIES: ABC transporter ATP-binding protein [Fischerella]|uniref:ABC transporter ATP-binding protein n=1 Tax=Fischerella muscicola CCMEE 5323 TaxID=2019572 RepID=A0A2N6K7G0_FISMU|nr:MULTISPECIES: ABC transporter ATP-binding protein [Fischerella]MBD2432781.1 ABC transporter ATP-binding protein [Fischerella sp. FACHB-380]PLZ93183.1 ABC transporter ATP-binding protein [Fischerella muscicola CCMEE 5323]